MVCIPRQRSRMKHLIVLFDLWIVAETARRSFPFTRRFTDYYCAFTISHDLSEASKSSTHCVSACQNHPTCVGVFYSSDDTLCHGVGYFYGETTSGCEWRPGYAFYQSGGYGDMCETNTHCWDFQTECKAGNCDCTFLYIHDGTMCRERRYGDSCVSSVQCPVDGTECRGGICDCVTVKIWDGGACRLRRYGDPCTSNVQCPEFGTECTGGLCDCVAVNMRDGDVCRQRIWGDPCLEEAHCAEWEHLTCPFTVCECDAVADYVYDGSACVQAWYCYYYTTTEQADIDLSIAFSPERDREICEEKGYTFVDLEPLPGACNDCYCCYLKS